MDSWSATHDAMHECLLYTQILQNTLTCCYGICFVVTLKVSTFDLMDPLQRGQPGHEDGFTNGSRLSYGPPGGSGAPSSGPPAPTAIVDGPPFVFPMGDPTFTTLRPISLRPPSLST